MKKKDEVKELLEKVDGLAEEIKALKEDGDGDDSGEDVKVAADLSEAIKNLGDRVVDTIEETIASRLPTDKEDKLKKDLFSTERGLPGVELPKLELVGKWQKAYRTGTKEERKEAGDNIIVSFLKSWVMEDRDPEAAKVFKALNEGTSADGGYLVPAPLAAEVWRVLPDYAVMRRIARTIPMTSQTLKVNSLSARPYAYWVSEYAKKTTTSAEFDQKTLTCNKLVCLLPVTHELLADANINLAQFVVELFAEAIATEEDKAFFTGSGTGRPKGITQETLTSFSAGASLNFDDIIKLIYSVPQSVRRSRNCAFVGNQTAMELLRKVKDGNNNYIWRDQGMFRGEVQRGPGAPDAIVYGYGIHEQNDLGREIYFGDWKYYLIGDRQQITVSKTDEGGDAWRRDATEFKAVERVDGRVVMTAPFAKLTY